MVDADDDLLSDGKTEPDSIASTDEETTDGTATDDLMTDEDHLGDDPESDALLFEAEALVTDNDSDDPVADNDTITIIDGRITRQWGSTRYDVANSVVVDKSGAIYVAGETNGYLDYTPASYDVPEGELVFDGFITKWTSIFDKEWTQLWGSAAPRHWNESYYGITTDGQGYLYATGDTESTLYSGVADIVVQKKNSAGITVWNKQIGTIKADSGKSVALDSQGYIYVTGYTGDALQGNTHFGSYDVFLTKWSSDGVEQWTKQWGSEESDGGVALAIDANDNLYITGFTAGAFDGNFYGGDECVSVSPCFDILLLKVNAEGEMLWSRQWGTSVEDYSTSLAADNSGNIYVTGVTTGDLDGNVFAGYDDIFLTKWHSDGTKEWTKQWGTVHFETGAGVATDSEGNIFVTGGTNGPLDGFTNAAKDIFLMKVYPDGVKAWTKFWGTEANDEGKAIFIDSADNIYVTGTTGDALDGNTYAGNTCGAFNCYDVFATFFFSESRP